MNVKSWYIYKNGNCIIGPTHFMGAVAGMNRLCVIGYPGNAVFQTKKSFRNGPNGDLYELSTTAPSAVTPVQPAPTKAPLGFKPNIVGVKFTDDVNSHSVYHFYTDIHFNPGDLAVVASPGGKFKIVSVVGMRTTPGVTPTSWIVDKIDTSRHQFRINQAEAEKNKQARAAEIRHLLDEKLATTTELHKYSALGDLQSVALVEELRKLTN